jgi:NADH:ubiquinone oxidoreductase subunit E
MNKTVSEELVLSWIKETGDGEEAAIPLLQKIQNYCGYLPREAMNLVVEHTKIHANKLYGIATFYAQFRLKPRGRHLIKVCHGTACHVRGADKINTALQQSLNLAPGEETSHDNAYTVENVACLGCCSLAPVMSIDDEVHGPLSGADVGKILKKYSPGKKK